jgi:threonine/homoserine/homoserine lactone efflux protein
VFDPTSFTLFVASALLLLITPGPAVLFIVARSLEQGRRAGIVSTLGICVGGLAHVAAAAFGLSALLLPSATAFTVVKYLGAAYLVYLGVRTLLVHPEPVDGVAPEPLPLRKIFTQALVVQILNPKTALFFFAFLPQFVDRSRPDVTAQVVGYGLLFLTMALVTDGAYALLAGSIGVWLKGRRDIRRAQRITSGVTYIALGVLAAVTGKRA